MPLWSRSTSQACVRAASDEVRAELALAVASCCQERQSSSWRLTLCCLPLELGNM